MAPAKKAAKQDGSGLFNRGQKYSKLNENVVENEPVDHNQVFLQNSKTKVQSQPLLTKEKNTRKELHILI